MDVVYNPRDRTCASSCSFIMDNDSGYVSNNLDQESNSDSVSENLNNSSVEILKSFIPKSVYINEDALLERPDLHPGNVNEENAQVDYSTWNSDDTSNMMNLEENETLSRVGSFQSDSGSSAYSIVVPVAKPIYYNLNSTVSTPPLSNEENISSNPSDGPFFGYENVPMEGANQVFGNCSEFECNRIGNEIQTLFLGLLDNKPLETSTTVYINNESKISAFKEVSTIQEVRSVEKQVENESCINDIPIFSEEHITIESVDKSDKIVEDDCSINLGAKTNEPAEKKEMENQETFVGVVDGGGQLKEPTDRILTNMTNISVTDLMEAGPSKASAQQRRNSVKNKENFSETDVFKTPSKTRKRKFSEIGSPCDLFSDSEITSTKPSPTSKIVEERFLHKFDQRLVKRVQRTLGGVPPPPDLTVTRLTVDDIMQKLEENKSLFWTRENLERSRDESVEKEKTLNESHNSSFGGSGSILIEGQLGEAINRKFPDILYSRHHGLHHNRSKVSEEIEHLCDKYAKRYIGAETQSTCTAVEPEHVSPSRRRTVKPKWSVKSPGRRLSHLAKRRITFSSASLQVSSSAGSRARQILVDYKKLELPNKRRSPKKTPSKSPAISPGDGRTPSSSAKKKLRMRFRLLSGDFKEKVFEPSSNISNSKRALFQSPDKDSKFKGSLPSSSSSISSFERDLANGGGVKRSLFSSPRSTSCRASLFPSPNKRYEKKRKRDDDDDEDSSNQPKFFRSQSSYSCCETEQKAEVSLTRAKSENMLASTQNEMSLANRKKLLWAVYDSLKDQHVTPAHPQFKVFASVLARVVRKCIISSNIRLESTGTSEKMLRIARRHVYSVVKGKTVEEIMAEVSKNQTKNPKPKGYVAPQDYNPGKDSALRDRDSNSGDSVTKASNQVSVSKPESRIDRIRKVINFEDRRQFVKRLN